MPLLAEKKERESREKAEKQRLAREEAERIAANKKKKKPLRYPTEDLDVKLADKDKKAGMKVQKPIPSRTALPFNEIPGVFESFLMSWNFLVVYGYVVSTWQPCCILIFSQPTSPSFFVYFGRI